MVPSGGATEKISNDTTGNGSRDRPTSSAARCTFIHGFVNYAVKRQVKTRISGRDLNVTSFNVPNQKEV